LALILCHLQLQDIAELQRALAGAPMDQGMELRGCVCRIKSSALELLSMEEDLTTDLDDDLWDLVRRDLQLKATFLYIDLNRVIACNQCEERREEITLLASDFFYFMNEVMRSVPSFPIFSSSCFY